MSKGMEGTEMGERGDWEGDINAGVRGPHAMVAARAQICQDLLRRVQRSPRIVHQVRAPICQGLPGGGLTPLTSELQVREAPVSSVGTATFGQRLWHILEQSEKEPAETAVTEIGRVKSTWVKIRGVTCILGTKCICQVGFLWVTPRQLTRLCPRPGRNARSE